ncbi:AAA family ATPase [Gracilibacillus massiliensis]|uniref:AAA family ATPase n=1 Tax=Gracilibacillus massiliensis TaxID=1564956 RepID=UPI00071E1920|nr:AAA family ATPase [Gracilibacillus massiliensis]
MYRYLFTNDLRISGLTEKMKETAKLFLDDDVPKADENKSANNNANTLGFFFNLNNCGACTQEAAEGNVRKVVLNFIRKFQYPNPRTKESYYKSVEDGVKIAPLRSILKLLFVARMTDGIEGFLTKKEILEFIFFNDSVAKCDNVNYNKIYSQIIKFRDTNGKEIPSSIAPIEKREWKQQDRQVKEMLRVLSWSGFVEEKNRDELTLKTNQDSNESEKAELMDIIMEEVFFEWTGDNFDQCKELYSNFMDEGVSEKRIPDYKSITTINENNKNKRNENLQTIYYGPPGTGKSYKATETIRESYSTYGGFNDDSPFVFRTTIYPDYSYNDFIGNIMPKIDKEKDNSITYEFMPGIFTLALSTAFNNLDKDIYLVIEEMSRGNIAAIFGDIFQLLDRDSYGKSEYMIKNELIGKLLTEEKVNVVKNNNIYLPENFHIVGTVNTSDQNVFVMDTAFKRRFEFEYVDLEPRTDSNSNNLNNYNFKLGEYEVNWIDFYQELNKFIVKELELPEDKQIGQFFLKFDRSDENANFRQILNKLLQYLWHDVQSVSIADEKLFKSELNSFAEAYKALKNRENIFNEILMKPFLDQEKKPKTMYNLNGDE